MNKIDSTRLNLNLYKAYENGQPLKNHGNIYYNVFNGNLTVITKKDTIWHKFWLRKCSLDLILSKAEDIFNTATDVNAPERVNQCKAIIQHMVSKKEMRNNEAMKHSWSRVILKLTHGVETTLKARKLVNELEDVADKNITLKTKLGELDPVIYNQMLAAKSSDAAVLTKDQQELNYISHYQQPQKVENFCDDSPIGTYCLDNWKGKKKIFIKSTLGIRELEIRPSSKGSNLFEIIHNTENNKRHVLLWPMTLPEISTLTFLMDITRDEISNSRIKAFLLSLGIVQFNKDGELQPYMITATGSLTSDITLINKRIEDGRNHLRTT